MRLPLRGLAVVIVASVWTTVEACSIGGIADGGSRPEAGSAEGGAADGADGKNAPACAADLAQDPANCGRCGRTCSGPCKDGVCDLTVIADGQGAIGAVATNGSFVAWSSDGRNIRVCTVQGCTTPTEAVRERDLTGYLAIDGDALLFSLGITANHGVDRCTLPDCKDDGSMGYDLGTPRALAVDQNDTFVLETEGRRVIHCGNGGCWNEIARNNDVDGAIALGLSNVYWSVLGAAGGPGAIYTCRRSGCPNGTPSVFAAEVVSARSLATDLSEVRWTSFDEGTVSSCPLAGCTQKPRLLAQDQKNPLGIASDGDRVYWANAGDGTIVACESAGCAAPEVIARGLDRPQWLALDRTHVYFTTAGGTVGRTLK